MALTIEDLQPKDFEITIGGELKLECKPPTLAHILALSKIGNIFQNINKSNRLEITQAQNDFNWVIGELVPDLKGKDLDFKYITEIITEIMQHVSPEETKELDELGVKIDSDPKAEGLG